MHVKSSSEEFFLVHLECITWDNHDLNEEFLAKTVALRTMEAQVDLPHLASLGLEIVSDLDGDV